MATSFIKARDPKMPNADKTRLATLILMGTNVNLLYIEVARFCVHILLQIAQPIT
jgi:hypothetical protein